MRGMQRLGHPGLARILRMERTLYSVPTSANFCYCALVVVGDFVVSHLVF